MPSGLYLFDIKVGMPGKQLEPRQQIRSPKDGTMRYNCMRGERRSDWQRWLRSSQWARGKQGEWKLEKVACGRSE